MANWPDEKAIPVIQESVQTESQRVKKAREAVESQAVKLHRFLPSGMTVWTVVGRDCDFFVDVDKEQDYCACSDFYFRVLSEKIPECYHLLALKMALKEEMYSVIDFTDAEFPDFLKALVGDIFAVVSLSTRSESEPQP